MRLLPMLAGFALIFAFALPTTTHASHAGPLTASCTNEEVGYTVNFPNNWFYNTRVSGNGAADVAACRFFSPNDFTITPGSEPTGVAIGIGVENVAFDPSEGEQVMVGGREAVRLQVESTTPGFEGTFYLYRIDLGGGQTLVARTSTRFVGPFEENKQILDAMMETLVFVEQPAQTPTPTPQPTLVPDAALPRGATSGIGSALALFGALLVTTGLMWLGLKRR